MKKKVVHLPLDERPCNYDFPYKMFKDSEFEIVRPPKTDMGFKRIPGNIERLVQFVIEETKDAYGLVVAIDTLLYGGIVPSRLHYENRDTLLQRLNVLRLIKRNNPSLKIFAYHLVMRCPQYNDDEEEPFYYRYCGWNIFRKGYIEHRIELGIATQEEKEELNNITIEPRFLEDYLNRREINTAMNIESLKLVKEGIIDFLIIPQDDSAPYGYTAYDQQKIRRIIEEQVLQLNVYMYPGADEIGCVLFSRMLADYKRKRPLVYIKYPSIGSATIYPTYEDRMLDTSVKYQITASGGLVASSVKEADLIFCVNAPSDRELPSSHQKEKGMGYTIQRNLVEFVEFIDYCINQLGKPVILGDIGFDNGGDIELIKLLDRKNLLMKLASYASWNIPCNSIGTAISFGVVYWFYGKTNAHLTFLLHRYLEDVGYCSHARYYIREHVLADHGYNIYYVGEQRGKISEITKQQIENFMQETAPSLNGLYRIIDCYMPWVRTYEVGLEVAYTKGDQSE